MELAFNVSLAEKLNTVICWCDDDDHDAAIQWLTTGIEEAGDTFHYVIVSRPSLRWSGLANPRCENHEAMPPVFRDVAAQLGAPVTDQMAVYVGPTVNG